MNEITLLTWNIWFKPWFLKRRSDFIVEKIRSLNPNVVALQEVVEKSAGIIDVSELTLVDGYKKVVTGVERMQFYWESTYTNLEIDSSSCRFAFANSKMGRGLTVLFCPELDLVVGNTHLESLKTSSTRDEQLKEACDILDDYKAKNKILMGDTNFLNDQGLGDVIPPGWTDCWPSLKPDDPGFTFDAVTNSSIEKKYQTTRLDRIYSKCTNLKLKQIEMIGRDPVQLEDGQSIHLSDHYGLFATFTVLDPK